MQNFSTNTETNADLSFSNHNAMVEDEQKQTPHINTNFNFVADQTPTPTRLLRNCEEVGLFDVNPFDETFRLAIESGVTMQSGSRQIDKDVIVEEETLHTPQVYPQQEVVTNDIIDKSMHSPTSAAVSFDLPIVEDFLSVSDISAQTKLDASRQNSTNSNDTSCTSKYRIIAEKSVFQLNAPAITLQLPNVAVSSCKIASKTALPMQSVKPFILPKLTNVSKDNRDTYSAQTPALTEPSSASLTPTSQLPIKERLKAILASNKKDKQLLLQHDLSTRSACRRAADDGMARKRAAAKRYRCKMRTEYEDLRKRNLQLESKNQQLCERIRQLEQQLQCQQTSAVQQILTNASRTGLAIPAQIQIPSATLSVLINLPNKLWPETAQVLPSIATNATQCTGKQ